MHPKELLFQKACEVRKKAYAPYSQFLVGACIEAEDGNLFVGCNVENASYRATTCAETNAISAMISAGKRKIKQIMLVVQGPAVSAPCGICRQSLNEFAGADMIVHLATENEIKTSHSLCELLPHAFGQNDLL